MVIRGELVDFLGLGGSISIERKPDESYAVYAYSHESHSWKRFVTIKRSDLYYNSINYAYRRLEGEDAERFALS